MKSRIQNAFDEVQASNELKESTIQYLNTKRKTHFVWRKPFVLACVVILLCIGGYSSLQIPFSYISMDVNPSLELTLNYFNRVIYASSYNEDAAILLEKVDVKGKPYTEAIDCILDDESMKEYITDDAQLSFTVACKNGNRERELLKGINTCTGCKANCSNVEEIEIAHENGMSFGKYKAYLSLLEYDDSITIDECKSMSMTQIHDKMQEHKGHGYKHGKRD